MLQQWLRMCEAYIARPAHFYSGARKIIQNSHYTFSAIKNDLHMEDVGFTKSKMTILKKFYHHDESIAVAHDLWNRRLERGTYGSVSFTTFNHFIKSEKTSIRASVMGPCIQSVVLTLTPDGTTIDCFYRTTELLKKFPADLVLLRDDLLVGFQLPDFQELRFHFANATIHPMYFVTLIPFLKHPVYAIESIPDPRLKSWVIKWTTRYLVPEYHNGIAKFAQALRVQKHALESIDKSVLDELRPYLKREFEKLRNGKNAISEPEDSDS